MGLSEEWESGQQIRVRPDHVGRDRALTHEGELDVDDIVGEPAAVEEARRARVVVRQDVGEQDLGYTA